MRNSRARSGWALVVACLAMLHPARTWAEATLPIGSASLHLSGQHRLLYGHTSAVNLGVAGGPDASVGLLRNLLGMELRIPRASIRVQAQLGAHFAFGTSERARPPDADWADVHLLFAEWTRAATGPARVSIQLRVGRQEMPLGSTRWFSTRDGTNVRQALDLVRLSLGTDRVTAHGFAGLLPRLQRGLFDDVPNPWDRIFGGYVTVHALPDDLLSIDVFALSRARPGVQYQDHAGRELRRTLGVRLFGQTSLGLEYVVHGLAQWGSLKDARVRAWGVALALWQRIVPAPYELRFGLRGDALSGDSSAHDRMIGTFHPLFPNQAFFSTQPAIYPANVYDVHPLLKLGVKDLELELGCALFWRQRTSDAVYGASGQALFSGTETRRAFTGAQLSGELLYHPTPQVTLMLAYALFFPGPALRALASEGARFLAASMTYAY